MMLFKKQNFIVHTTLLITICFAALFFTSCSDSDKPEKEKEFALAINFEQFLENVNERYESFPVRIDVFYYSQSGNFERFSTDSPLGVAAFSIPTNAIFFGIIARVKNMSVPEEDWVAMAWQYVFNDNPDTNVEAIEEYVPFYVAEDFNTFEYVGADVIDIYERIDLYFNGEKIDLDERVIPVQKADPPGPKDVPDTRYAPPANQNESIAWAFLNFDNLGTRYKPRVDSDSGNSTVHHFQGMGWYRDRYVVFTHYATSGDSDGPKIYLIDTSNNTSRSIEAIHYSTGDIILHPGGGQVIEDYFVFSGVIEDDGGIYIAQLALFDQRNIKRIHYRATDQYANSAVGVTKVRSDYIYGSGDTVAEDPELQDKYIIALVDYDARNVLVYRTPLGDLYNLNDGDLHLIGTFDYNGGGNYDNIALFTEHDGSIYMIAFYHESYNDNVKPHEVVINMYKIMRSTTHHNIFDIADNKDVQHSRTLKITEEGHEYIKGRWGATAYFDGQRMHVFMSNRNMDVQGDISFNHW